MSWTLKMKRFLERADLAPGERLPARLIDRAPPDALDWVARQFDRADLSDEYVRRLTLLSAELWAREGSFEPLLTTVAEEWMLHETSPVPWLQALADAGHWHAVRTHLRLWERSPTDDEREAIEALIDRARSQAETTWAAVEVFVARPSPTTWRALLPFVPAAHKGPPGSYVVGEMLRYGIPARQILHCLLEAGETALAEGLVRSGIVDEEASWQAPTAEA